MGKSRTSWPSTRGKRKSCTTTFAKNMAKGRGFPLVLEGIEAKAVGKGQDLTVVDMVAAAGRVVAATGSLATTGSATGVAGSEVIEVIEVIEVSEVDATRRIVMIENVMNAKRLKV